MMNKVRKFYELKAIQSTLAFCIIKDGEHRANVIQHIGDSGTVKTVICANGKSPQYGSASGNGYDNLTASLRGLIIDDIKLVNHCEEKDQFGDYVTGGLYLLNEKGYQVIMVV